MQIAECFKILNVDPGEDWRKVRKSYHSLARRFHPDINPGTNTVGAFSDDTRLKVINQAFEKLESHYKTSHKFQQLEPFEQKTNKFSLLLDGLKDKPSIKRVLNSTSQFLVGLDTKVFQLDVQKNINLSGASQGASLHLKSGKEHLEVKVPLGDWNHMSLRIPGKGESSIFSRRRGDLVLNLRAPIRNIVSTEKSRFFYETRISGNQIAERRVMTLISSEGPIKFILPRNTQDGQRFTLRSGSRGETKSGTLHIVTVRLN
jgi:curved DNA-binding protein